MNSEQEISKVKSLGSLLEFLLTQNFYGYIFVIFIFLVGLLFLNAKLVITTHQIYVESFGFNLRHIVDKELLQHARLYSSFASSINVLRPISKKKLNYDQKLKLSSIGFCLQPEYRSDHLMKQLELKQFSCGARREIVRILDQYWDLEPQKFVGREELVRLKFKHKLR
ncbi:hypothetical protein F7P77_14895 [Acinetobacter courvalinii]|nr:hypothetical protein F7P77_14895 [Acinetobacter courvalinii]